MKYCTHEDCRADTIQDLWWLAPLLGKQGLKDAAAAVLAGEVRCRHVPRDGTTPFYARVQEASAEVSSEVDREAGAVKKALTPTSSNVPIRSDESTPAPSRPYPEELG